MAFTNLILLVSKNLLTIFSSFVIQFIVLSLSLFMDNSKCHSYDTNFDKFNIYRTFCTLTQIALKIYFVVLFVRSLSLISLVGSFFSHFCANNFLNQTQLFQ